MSISAEAKEVKVDLLIGPHGDGDTGKLQLFREVVEQRMEAGDRLGIFVEGANITHKQAKYRRARVKSGISPSRARLESRNGVNDPKISLGKRLLLSRNALLDRLNNRQDFASCKYKMLDQIFAKDPGRERLEFLIESRSDQEIDEEDVWFKEATRHMLQAQSGREAMLGVQKLLYFLCINGMRREVEVADQIENFVREGAGLVALMGYHAPLGYELNKRGVATKINYLEREASSMRFRPELTFLNVSRLKVAKYSPELVLAPLSGDSLGVFTQLFSVSEWKWITATISH